MLKKGIFFLLLVFLSACSTHVVGDKPRVTVILKTMSSEYWRFVERGVNQACKDFKVYGTVLGPASEGHIVEQVHLLEDVFNQKPDALVIAPILPSTIKAVLERSETQKIPAFFLDTDVDWQKKAAYVGIDNITAGRVGAEALASRLKRGDYVALLGGALGNFATDERIKGAKEVLVEKGMKIVAEQPADSDKAKAMSVMENILQTHAQIKGVFAANDEMALGAVRAIEERNLDVKVIGTDGTVEALQSILKGNLTATVAQNPYQMGYMAIENALKKVKGEKVSRWIDSGVELVVRENAKEKLHFLQKHRGE